MRKNGLKSACGHRPRRHSHLHLGRVTSRLTGCLKSVAYERGRGEVRLHRRKPHRRDLRPLLVLRPLTTRVRTFTGTQPSVPPGMAGWITGAGSTVPCNEAARRSDRLVLGQRGLCRRDRSGPGGPSRCGGPPDAATVGGCGLACSCWRPGSPASPTRRCSRRGRSRRGLTRCTSGIPLRWRTCRFRGDSRFRRVPGRERLAGVMRATPAALAEDSAEPRLNRTAEAHVILTPDFRSQERTIKDSGYWYGRVAASNRLDV